jgi:hypothetical protein
MTKYICLEEITPDDCTTEWINLLRFLSSPAQRVRD